MIIFEYLKDDIQILSFKFNRDYQLDEGQRIRQNSVKLS